MVNAAHFQPEPIAAVGTLADRVAEVLLQKIKSGEFALNTRLPSEVLMAERFAVSRTVIREAVSRLKSEGLVEARQGSGTIVVKSSMAAPFRIDADTKNSVHAVLRVIELRRGLEADMAALAAERRTEAQLVHIKQALLTIDLAVMAGGDGVKEDFAFHTAISQATGNPLYTALLQFLSQFMEATIRVGRSNEARCLESRGKLRAEHEAIVDAIVQQNVTAARAAAWRHMENVAARIGAADQHFWNSATGRAARKLAQSDTSG